MKMNNKTKDKEEKEGDGKEEKEGDGKKGGKEEKDG